LLFCWVPRIFLRQTQTVEQWGVFELTLNGPTNGNPFLDVKFSAWFRQGGLISTRSTQSNFDS